MRSPASRTVDAGLALLPLRLFLGVTFVYAGIQKLADPGYLHPGAPTYIGTQLHAFATGTPGGFLLRTFALPQPKLVGVVVALLEIVVGLLAAAGLLTRVAAGAGLALNLVLFLTNSWKVHPYFLGSDIVFIFAWLPFVLLGAGGQPAVDNELERLAAARGRRPAAASGTGTPLTRRAILLQGVGLASLAALILGGAATLTRGSYRGRARALGSGSPAAGAAGSPKPTAQGALPQGAVNIGPSGGLIVGRSAIYKDPGDGQDNLLIRQGDGSLTALSAVCTHQGCTVAYQGGQILCPCHGGVFNGRTGAVEGGPPPTGLSPRRVLERGGRIYAVPS
ncbi:MAG: hypothetical protein NVSMB25_19310 [Thermoleophilaceae bacterium]